MQYTEIFKVVKMIIFSRKKHRLWVHIRTASVSNEYPQCMFLSKNKNNRFTPAYPFFYIKVGYKGVFISQTCFPDVKFLCLKFVMFFSG